MAKQTLKQSIGFAISLILIYLVLFKPHPGAWISGELGLVEALFGKLRFGMEDLKQAGKMLHPVPALIAVTLLVISLFLRSLRWQYLISPVGKTRYRTVFWSNCIGYLMNNILPLRAGELIRAVILARFSRLPAGSLIATVVLERLFDLAGLGMLFGVTLTLYAFPQWIRVGGGVMSMVIAIVLLTGWMLASSSNSVENWILKIIRNRGRLIQKLGIEINNVLHGLSGLSNRGVMIHMLWTTILLWMVYTGITKFVLDAFSLTDGRYPLLYGSGIVEGAVITVVSSLGMGLPSAPGAVGTYHGAVMLTLAWFEVQESISVIIATALHAMNYLTLSFMGLIGLWRLRLSWSWIIKHAKSNKRTSGDVLSQKNQKDNNGSIRDRIR